MTSQRNVHLYQERRVRVLTSHSTPNRTSFAKVVDIAKAAVVLDGGISHNTHGVRHGAFHPSPCHAFALRRCVVHYVPVYIVVLGSVVTPTAPRGSCGRATEPAWVAHSTRLFFDVGLLLFLVLVLVETRSFLRVRMGTAST